MSHYDRKGCLLCLIISMDPRAPARIVKPNTGQHVDAYIEYC